MKRSLIALVAAGILAISGCGQAAPDPALSAALGGTRAVAASTSTTPSTAAQSEGRLSVTQVAVDPTAVWFVRVERATGEGVVERSYATGPVTFTTGLGSGEYRVLAWRRPCTRTCPTVGEAGLGDLEGVCGAKVRITAGTTTRANLTSTTAGDCSLIGQ